MADEGAHLLGALMLVLSVALLIQRRLSMLIDLCALQALVLAAAAGWLGFAEGAPLLFLTGLMIAAANVYLVPRALRRLTGEPAAEGALGLFPALAMAIPLVVLAMVAVLPATPPLPAPNRDSLAIALAVSLLGVLVMITRRNPPGQAIGFVSLGHGVVLAVLGVPDMPDAAVMAAAVLLLTGVAGLFLPGVAARN